MEPSSRQGSGASPAATEASHDRTQHPSLKHNGPSHSNGSSHHDEGSCKPCAFYCFSKSGCFRGNDCKFCHLFHQSRTLKKRDVSVSSHQPSHQEGLDMPRTPHEAKPRASTGSPAADRNGRHRRVAFEEPPDSTLYVPDSEISLKSSLPTFAPVNAAGKSKTQGAHTNCHIGETFAYMPSGAERVGQKVFLVPMINDALPRVFAVAPELPQGLTIDKRTGVIQGTPQEATNGPIPYFVTSCDPCGNFGVSTAMIHINVLSVSAPGCSAGEVLHEAGLNMASSNEEMFRAHSMPPKQEGYERNLEVREKVQQELVAQLTAMTMQLYNTSHAQQSHN